MQERASGSVRKRNACIQAFKKVFYFDSKFLIFDFRSKLTGVRLEKI